MKAGVGCVIMYRTEGAGITAMPGEETPLPVTWLVLHASFQTKNKMRGKLAPSFLIDVWVIWVITP